MKRNKGLMVLIAVAAMTLTMSQVASASGKCAHLPKWADLKAALDSANDSIQLTLNNEMWGAIISADGRVCAVAHTGADALQSQWLASRLIALQKGSTANSLSLGAGQGGDIPGLALSTANLWAAVQPGGSLYGLQHSNPVDSSIAYIGKSKKFGTSNDPLTGYRVGGINVFGGGLALYDEEGRRVGAVGVSGDTSCRDHMVAWELRHNLELDYVPAGLSGPSLPDNIIFDIDPVTGTSASGFGHPNCLDAAGEQLTAINLTPVPQ